MHQPGYCSVVFGVLGDFRDARQAVGWRKMKISTDRNMDVEKKYLEENLAKGYILECDRPYGHSTFYVKKKN